tara:strand:+ start:5141 stop:6121 length:981 start_codon:yes stop_codon:yes gene_type:complete
MYNKKIVVTGAFGFIGSTLVERLVERGYKVVAFDRYNSDSFYGNLDNSKYYNDIEFIMGDIRDFDSVNKTLKDCSICLHLAALIGIPYSYLSPLAYLKTNLEGTYNIIESTKLLGIEQTIVTSTSEVYGTAQNIPISENHRLNAQSPYAASKIAADNIALSYFNSFNTPIKVIRPFNTFGARQSARAIIPTLITQCLNKNKFIKIGNINVKRDFTYVDDLCDAYIESIFSDKLYGEVFNVGNNRMISIKELLNLIMVNLKVQKEIKIENIRIRKETSEVFELQCDNSKFLNFTNWKPKINLEDGLSETINWIKKNISKFNKNIYHV